MGLRLICMDSTLLNELSNSAQTSRFFDIKKENLESYFFNEFFSRFSPLDIDSLTRISIPDKVPVELARILTGRRDIDQFLKELEHKNIFTRRLDEKGSVFQFHDLFRNSLRKAAEKKLSQKQRERLLLDIATWFMGRGEYEPVLHCLVELGDLDLIDVFLKRAGSKMYEENRIHVVYGLLNEPCLSGFRTQRFATESVSRRLPGCSA